MREHRDALEMPHPPERVWALMQDYARWTAYAPMLLRVDVVYPSDAQGNGLLRRVVYRLPFGRRGSALELVTGVTPARGYTYTMLSRTPGNDQTGRVELEPLPGRRTRLRFEERYQLGSLPWRWFEGPIYRFINRQNEASMRALSDWLGSHPEYRFELA
jgi:hypothetical protein